MTDQEKALGAFLSRIADELNISPTMQEKAVSSYQSVGKWIGDGLDYDVEIMPQGSMNLGTVVRPIDDSDDGYDMDLVCLLKNGQYLTLRQIKNLVGDRLKEHAIYKEKLDKEGKRCWTMNYDGFHMDILPCVSKDGSFIKPYRTAIKLTHKNEAREYEPRYSNPYQYRLWFEDRMKDILLVEKRAFAAKAQTEIDKVPTYKIRTPLQKTIQLLKRHRDICFQQNGDDAPISIIITTLAAKAYSGETDLYEALCNILKRIPENIECRDGVYWVENPVMSEENFADKWNQIASKRTAFFNWLARARREIVDNPLACFGTDEIAKRFGDCLGEAPVNRAVKAMGNDAYTARQSGNLFINGLTGGISTTAATGSKAVKEHTFFGQ